MKFMLNAQKAYNDIFKKNITEIGDFPKQEGGGGNNWITYLKRESPAYKLVDIIEPIHTKFNRIPIIHLILPNNQFSNYVSSIASLSYPVSLEESKLIMTGGGKSNKKRKPPLMLPVVLYDNASINHLQHEHYRSLVWRNHLINNWIVQTKPSHYDVLSKMISNILPRFNKCYK